MYCWDIVKCKIKVFCLRPMWYNQNDNRRCAGRQGAVCQLWEAQQEVKSMDMKRIKRENTAFLERFHQMEIL